MRMEDLALESSSTRNVSIAPPKGAIVCDQNKLIHMIMKRLRHMIERTNILIQSWDCEHVRVVSEVGG